MIRIFTLIAFLGTFTFSVLAQTASPTAPLISKSVHQQDATFLLTNNNGNSVFSAGRDGSLFLLDFDSCSILKTFTGNNEVITCLAQSKDGKFLLSGYEDGTITLWDIENAKKIKTIRNHEGPVRGVAFSQDAKTKFLYSCAEDGFIKGYDREMDCKWVLTSESTNPLTAMVINYEGKMLYVGDQNGNIIGVKTKDLKKEIDLTSKHKGQVNCLSLSPDGNNLLSGGVDFFIKITNLTENKETQSWKAHTWKVFSAHFNPSQEYIISSSNDGNINLWDAKNYQLIKSFSLAKRTTFSSAVFSKDCKRIMGTSQVTKPNQPSNYIWETGISAGPEVKPTITIESQETPKPLLNSPKKVIKSKTK